MSNQSRRQRENQERRAAAQAAQNRRRTRFLVYGGLAVVVVIAAVVAVALSSSGSDAQASQYEQAPVKVTGTPLPPFKGPVGDPAIGDTIPTLQGVSVFNGDPVKIAPNGKPQAIVFVAHWCPHCQAEVPRLVALAKRGAFDGVDVTAVATGTNTGYPNYPPSAWLKRDHWPFPVMADSKDYAAANAYGLTAYPYFVLVDQDGKVAGRASGEVTDADVVANLKALKAGEPLPLLKSGASSSAS